MKAVKAMQASLAEERLKQSWDEKFKRAEEKRNLHLKTIQEKAHDEAIKLREIAFIKELEAQNKKHDMDALWQASLRVFVVVVIRVLRVVVMSFELRRNKKTECKRFSAKGRNRTKKRRPKERL